MKKIALFIIDVYQKFISSSLKVVLGVDKFCRFSPTCSEFAKTSILQYGLIKGGFMATIRILSCQPFQLEDSKDKLKEYIAKARLYIKEHDPILY